VTLFSGALPSVSGALPSGPSAAFNFSAKSRRAGFARKTYGKALSPMSLDAPPLFKDILLIVVLLKVATKAFSSGVLSGPGRAGMLLQVNI
jgi:hypothetical protein